MLVERCPVEERAAQWYLELEWAKERKVGRWEQGVVLEKLRLVTGRLLGIAGKTVEELGGSEPWRWMEEGRWRRWVL